MDRIGFAASTSRVQAWLVSRISGGSAKRTYTHGHGFAPLRERQRERGREYWPQIGTKAPRWLQTKFAFRCTSKTDTIMVDSAHSSHVGVELPRGGCSLAQVHNLAVSLTTLHT